MIPRFNKYFLSDHCFHPKIFIWGGYLRRNTLQKPESPSNFFKSLIQSPPTRFINIKDSNACLSVHPRCFMCKCFSMLSCISIKGSLYLQELGNRILNSARILRRFSGLGESAENFFNDKMSFSVISKNLFKPVNISTGGKSRRER